MLAAANVLGDASGTYMRAAVAAGEDVWARGLLRKGVGLCHGAPGNGYALLALAGATGAPRWRAAAQAFASWVAQHWQELYDVPDRPASLYEGLAGAVCFMLDAVEVQPGGDVPGGMPGGHLPT